MTILVFTWLGRPGRNDNPVHNMGAKQNPSLDLHQWHTFVCGWGEAVARSTSQGDFQSSVHTTQATG